MKINKISRRAFLLGLGAVSPAALLSACGGSASSSSAASGSAASGSAAAAGSDVFRTLDEIKADGTVNIGVFSDKNPFGYVDENGEYQGYDVYFARRLGEDLGVEINFVSTEAANRIEYLQTGKADVILANFTVTPERAEEVDFALPYMNVALGVISPDSNVIKSLDNWNSKDQMIVISGTTAERLTTAVSGARFPFRIAIPPVWLYGLSIGRITSGFLLTQPLIFSPTVLPVTVMQSRFKRFFLDSSFITAYTPPASFRSSI